MTTTERGMGRVGRFREGSVTQGAGESLGDRSVPRSVSSKAAPRRGDVPFSIEAERSVLSGILLECETAWDKGIDQTLNVEDFYFEAHQIIYRAMLDTKKRGWPVTVVTVAHVLSELGLIDDLDKQLGPPWAEPYLAELACDFLSPLWLKPHAEIIKDYAERRRQIQLGQELIREAYAGPVKRRLGGVRID